MVQVFALACGKSDVLPSNPNVVFTEQQMKQRGEYNFWFYEGKLKNAGDLSATLVYVKVAYFDKNGILLERTGSYAEPSDLDDNQEAAFSVFIGDLPADRDDSKTQYKVEWVNR